MNKKAVVLLSGGLDSTTCLYIAKKRGYISNCLIFDYGQRHKKELNSAVKIAKNLKTPYHIIKIKLPWDTSSLINKTSKIPTHGVSNLKKIALCPSTYVPGRNTIFISYALSYAETIKAKKIFIGANAVDFSGYPDCRPLYYKSWNTLLQSLNTSVKIEAPLLKLSKSQIIKKGASLAVPYETTWSCYKGGARPCGKCDSCRLRAKGFAEAGLKDPL